MSLIELSAFRHAQSEISVIFALSDRPEDSSGFPPYAASCFPLRPQRHFSAISAVKTIPNRYPREPPWNFPQPKGESVAETRTLDHANPERSAAILAAVAAASCRRTAGIGNSQPRRVNEGLDFFPRDVLPISPAHIFLYVLSTDMRQNIRKSFSGLGEPREDSSLCNTPQIIFGS